MSTSTQQPSTGSDTAAPPRASLGGHEKQSPWVPWAIFGAAAVLALAIGLLTSWNIVLFVIYTVVLGTLGVYLFSRATEGRRKATDRLVTCLVVCAFGIALVPLLSLVYEVIRRGAERFDLEFLTASLQGVIGEGGGAYHALMGTLIITALATLISVPIGLMTAIYLVEYGTGRLKRSITFFVDVMTGIPSIVAGLFAYALFVLVFGPGIRLGIMGAVALSVLMIPVVVRSCEEVLKLVPNELREAAYALGVPKWRTIVKVVIPTAIAGLGTGITLAIARVAGETAPLLITVGITNAMNFNPFDGRMATLPVYAYYQLTQPGVPPENAIARAWTAALLLIILVMGLNVVARLISRFFAPKTGR
ncbi:phosphate ABC transporter permease PstA [Modestobacter sp. SYSU DS0290]